MTRRKCEWLIIPVVIYLVVTATWITVVILALIHAPATEYTRELFQRQQMRLHFKTVLGRVCSEQRVDGLVIQSTSTAGTSSGLWPTLQHCLWPPADRHIPRTGLHCRDCVTCITLTSPALFGPTPAILTVWGRSGYTA